MIILNPHVGFLDTGAAQDAVGVEVDAAGFVEEAANVGAAVFDVGFNAHCYRFKGVRWGDVG